MLRPAQLYKEQLKIKDIESWYNPSDIFYHSGTGAYSIDLPDNNENLHAFVSVDKDDNIIGYISYRVDWRAMNAYQFGIISYHKGNMEFIRDLYKAIDDCFNVYHFNRIEWFCIADNPAICGYRNFIKHYGGRECGYCRQALKLRDGKLHDYVTFEILAGEFKGKMR